LKEYLSEPNKKDDLLLNVLDYFTEKWNSIKSDGTEGLMKSFTFAKKKKIPSLKIMFPNYETKGDQVTFRSYRETEKQTLKIVVTAKNTASEEKIIYNKRKLTEFLNIVEKLNSDELSFEILQNNIYNDSNFLQIEQEYSGNHDIFQSINKNPNSFLAASYYGHINILKSLNEKKFDVAEKNILGISALLLGNINLKSLTIKSLFQRSAHSCKPKLQT
jgi:hypothetical protein